MDDMMTEHKIVPIEPLKAVELANDIRAEVATCKWCGDFPENTHSIAFNHATWMQLAATLEAAPSTPSEREPVAPVTGEAVAWYVENYGITWREGCQPPIPYPSVHRPTKDKPEPPNVTMRLYAHPTDWSQIEIDAALWRSYVATSAAAPLPAPERTSEAWIAVSERIPDADGDTLVFPGWAQAISIEPFCLREGCWLMEFEDGKRVTHWQPLPSPPLEQQNPLG